MPGFNFYYNTSSPFQERLGLVCQQLKGNHFQVDRFTLNKFLEDKLFYEDDDKLIVLEGIILNKKDLRPTLPHKTWLQIVWELYLNHGETFFSVFRGCFTGILFDKRQEKWILFTDQLGTRLLYFYREDKRFVASTGMKDIYDYLTWTNKKPKLNVDAAFMMLSYGFMLNDNTLCNEIKKLEAGHYILLEKGKVDLRKYYELPKSSVQGDCNENETIEQLDEHFRKAIQLQFEKDREYGYKHFVSLSGGLDSRMATWVAHEMGYCGQINFTFSQSDYLDETVAKKIATDLKHEWMFKALDNGLFLKDIEEINLLTGGNVLYYGLAHSNSFYRLINFSRLGLIHTGQLGDVVIGSFIKRFSTSLLTDPGGAYSDKFVSLVQTKPPKLADFADVEMFLMYQRAINGANNGLLSSLQYTETMSPFYDIDFFEFCLSIPISVRMEHKLYKKWILKKYPKAADYVWEATKRKVKSKMPHLHILDRQIPVDQLHSTILRRMGLKKPPQATKDFMNPLDYWYLTNSDIKIFQDDYFNGNIGRLDHYPKLKSVCSELYYTGTGAEKNQALTLVSALKLFSIE